MKKTFLALCSIAILLYACKDEDIIINNESKSTQATEDHIFAEKTFSDIVRVIEEGFLASGVTKSCPSYNLTTSNIFDIDMLIVNFGTINCLHNNKLRRGKIFITYTAKYRDSLAVMTANFENFYVNNNLVEGEIIITNEGRNKSGNMCFTILVNNASIVTENGKINWSSNRKKEWISGTSTYLDITDDKYKITGFSSGIAVNNNSFSVEITDSLNIDLSCLPSCVIKSGHSKISPNGYDDRIINYGDSLCDCNFDVMINGEKHLIVVN